MNSSKSKREWLKNLLTQAYQEKEKIKVGDSWRGALIHRIQEMGEDQATLKPHPTPFAQFTWRLAPLVGVLILILSFLLITDLTSDDQVFLILLNGADDLTSVPIF
jgi:hypothetical protein